MSTQNGQIEQASNEHLFVKQNGMLVRIHPAEIHWVEASDSSVYIHTQDKRYYVGETLKDLLEKISGLGLMRVHRSYAVNMNKISALSESELLIGKKRIPIGRTHRKELMERITIL